MRNGRRILYGGLVAFALLAAAGCAQNTNFVYRPGPAAQGVVVHPAKVAVLPFRDGTEDFTKKGSVLKPETLVYNLAKSGVSGSIDALIPEFWAKSFAEELAASGAFRSVRFVYNASELLDESYFIEGAVLKAYAKGGRDVPSEYALDFRASRRADKRQVWEKQVTRSWKVSPEIYKECGTNAKCMGEKSRAELNRMMQGMFAEAGEDFARTLASAGGKPASAPTPEPVDATIDRILKGP
ncbi:MAG: hypothetical protein AB1346_03625 [Thermodesulfobacteriota bacterium]